VVEINLLPIDHDPTHLCVRNPERLDDILDRSPSVHGVGDARLPVVGSEEIIYFTEKAQFCDTSAQTHPRNAMNTYLTIILASLIGAYLLNVASDLLNLRSLEPELPDEFRSVSDPDTYRRSQDYTRARTRLGLLASSVDTLLILIFLLAGGFNLLDLILRQVLDWPLLRGIAYFTILFLLSDLITMPFQLYSIFSLEERFGFNTMNFSLFLKDKLKSYVLAALIGLPLLSAVLLLFTWDPGRAWLLCWLLFCAAAVLLQFIAPRFILPLFNRFTPLEEGGLRDQIEHLARENGFNVSGIYVMDGSSRSTKSNAFFTGFGRTKRIALYDTLLGEHEDDEILAILAHELGHSKLGHIRMNLLLLALKTGIVFWLLSLFVTHEPLFAGLGMEQVSVYAGIVFFFLLFTPLSLATGILFNMISRLFEYQADAFARRAMGSSTPLIRALKKLAVKNLSNLTPHPLYAFVHYSHPPIMRRISTLRMSDPNMRGAA
jgi:STE24 endopeptidase